MRQSAARVSRRRVETGDGTYIPPLGTGAVVRATKLEGDSGVDAESSFEKNDPFARFIGSFQASSARVVPSSRWHLWQCNIKLNLKFNLKFKVDNFKLTWGCQWG